MVSSFDIPDRILVAIGGGGIPVIRGPNGVRKGVQAVVDKDLTSAHMANVLGVELPMILTAAASE